MKLGVWRQFLVAALSLLPLQFSFGAEAGMPSAGELIALAPRISFEEEDIFSFEVRGTIRGEGRGLRFIVLGQRPDRYTLALIDPQDGTPIAVATQGRLAFYNPLKEDVTILEPMHPVFVMALKEATDREGLDFDMSIGFSNDIDDANKIIIDVRSLVATGQLPHQVSASGKDRYVLERQLRSGSKVVAQIKKTRKEGHYESIELEPVLTLDGIRVNHEIPPQRFAFPGTALKSSGLAINEIEDKPGTGPGTFDGMRAMGLAIWARAVMHGLTEDTELELTDIERARLEQADKKIAATLRDVFAEILAPPQR